MTRQVLTLIELRHGGESQRTADLFTAVTAATDEVMADVLAVEAIGDDDLTRFFDLALIGQLVLVAPRGAGGCGPGSCSCPRQRHAHANAALPGTNAEAVGDE